MIRNTEPRIEEGFDHCFGHPNEYSELGKERIRQLAAKNSFPPKADNNISSFAVL